MANVTRRRILAAPLALALSACGQREKAGGKQSAILMRGNGPDPDSLDPHKARANEAMVVLRDLFEGLTRLDRNAAPVPAAAESWTVSDDGRVYTFKLRPNLRWSSGEPLVAEDFAAGLRRLVDPVTASQYAQVIDVILNAPDIVAGKKPVDSLGVAAPDTQTFVITLSTPAPYLPGLMAHPSTAPLHRPSFAKFGERFARPGDQVSNGAFVLTEWLQGSYIRAARNTHYWNNAANKLDGVKFLQITDENAELRAYRAGELHSTRAVPRGQFDWIKENLSAELHIAPQISTYYYGFNLDRGLFSNPKLRQALSMAIDRERLATSVLRVGELPAYGWVPPGMNNYDSQVVRIRHDARGRTHRDRAQIAGRSRLHARQTAAIRAAVQFRRGAHQGCGGSVIHVEGGARSRSAPGRGGVQVVVRRHRSARSRHVPVVLGGGLQRPVHLPPVSEEVGSGLIFRTTRAPHTTRFSMRPHTRRTSPGVVSCSKRRSARCWRIIR